MPELPEVETMCRGLAPVVGGRITGVELLPCPRRPLTTSPNRAVFIRRQTGATIIAVERLGKRVILVLDNGYRTVIEPRMTGLMLLADPPTQEHLRIQWTISGARSKRFWYWDQRGLGIVRVVNQREFDRYYPTTRIGPDALQIDERTFRERTGRSRRAIKVALLDQAALAGVGNLYASEMLHLARIHPAMRADRLQPAEWSLLFAALRDVLLTAIEYEGSTLGDGTYRNVLNKDGGYQNEHRVYDRAEESCPQCRKGVIVRIVQAQRSTFYCPVCQPQPARGRIAKLSTKKKSLTRQKTVASRDVNRSNKA